MTNNYWKDEELFVETDLPNTLTNEECCYYIQEYRTGNINARDILVEHNIRLVKYVALKFYHNYKDLDDLFCEGCNGLLRAIDTFDVSYGVPFSLYAINRIRGKMSYYIKKQKQINEHNVLFTDYYNPETVTSIDDIAIDEFDISKDYEDKEYIQIARTIIDSFTENDKRILFLYYSNNLPNQSEIARILGVHRSYVNKVILKAEKVIKEYFNDTDYSNKPSIRKRKRGRPRKQT